MKAVVILTAAVFMLSLTACEQADFKKTKSGLPYKVWHSNKEGKKLKEGDIIKFNVMTKLNDSVLYSSYGGLPEYMPIRNTGQSYDFTEILPLLQQGDSVYAVQMVDSLLAQNPNGLPPAFTKGSKIITQFKVLDVFEDQRAAMDDRKKEEESWQKNEGAAVEAYLQKNNIDAKKTADGVYVETVEAGSGPACESGKELTVNYTGKTFDGTMIDSNIDTSFHHTEPMSFVLDRDPMIPGFALGLKELHQGAKANIYMPSLLGYGGNPRPGSNLKPYQNLIFYVEVLDVKDAPKEEAPQVPGRN